MSDADTKVPAIPSLSGIADPEIRKVLQAIKELLEVRDGRRGNDLDQMVLWREITDAGIATFNSNRKRIEHPFPEQTDFTAPSALTNFTATGGYAQVFLDWDVVNSLNYLNFSHVEIWRSDTDAIGSASKIGQTTASVYSDACGVGKTFYYWGRLVSVAGVVGPFNAVHGTVASTAIDVALTLQALTGAITESQLYQDLGARIDLIDAPETALNSVNARVKTLRDSTTTSIAQVNARVDVVESVDQDLITAVNQIIVVDQGQASEIYLEQTARISADNAQAAQISTISALVGQNAAAISSETTARATQDSALAGRIDTLISRVGSAESSITSNYTTLAGVDSTQAAALNTLTSTVNGNTASIQTQQTTTNGLLAQYTVKIDANGYVSGFGLASTLNNATPYSEFGVRADRFYIGSPGQTSIIPFVVTTSPTIINGVSVPVGVYMDAAYIKNGTLTNTKIGDAAIDNAKIADLSADKINAGFLSADRIDANTITGDKLSVTNLAAKLAAITTAYITNAHVVSLDAGSITSGTISAGRLDSGVITAKVANLSAAQIQNLDASKITTGTISAERLEGSTINSATITLTSGGHIKGGQSGYATGSGFFLGLDSGAHKFSIGNSNNYLRWDGSALTVKGTFTGADYIPGTYELGATSSRTVTSIAASPTTVLNLRVVRNGTVSISWDTWTTRPDAYLGYSGLYITDGGPEYLIAGPVSALGTTVSSSLDLAVIAGWTIMVKAWQTSGANGTIISNFKVACGNPNVESSSV